MTVERVSDIVDFSPYQCQLPSLSSNSLVTKESIYLTNPLKNPYLESPFPSPGTEDLKVLENLAEIFRKAT